MPAPFTVIDGLAVYRSGAGAPALFMPHPHPASLIGDRVPTELIEGMVRLKRHVVTFDPPGAGHSTRAMRLDMDEMVSCAAEALDAAGVGGPADVIGHSQGGLAAIAFALAHPARVKTLVLVCATAGAADYMRADGAIWNRTHPAFRRFAVLGALLLLTGRLAAQKATLNLIKNVSFVDRSLAQPSPIGLCDFVKPAHPRMAWTRRALRLDYHSRLREIHVPTLCLAGRYDPQIPASCVEAIARGIAGARFVAFDRSGHYPFIEEKARFWKEVSRFLAAAG